MGKAEDSLKAFERANELREQRLVEQKRAAEGRRLAEAKRQKAERDEANRRRKEAARKARKEEKRNKQRQLQQQQGSEAQAKEARARKLELRRATVAMAKRCLDAATLPVEETALMMLAPTVPGESVGGLIDAAVATFHQEALLRAIVDNFDGTGLNLHAAHGKHGIVLNRGGTPVALVSATHATFRIRRLGRIEGDFVGPGPHWAILRARLVGAFSEHEQVPERAQGSGLRVLKMIPEEVPEAARRLAIEASRRIRTERTLDFGHPVVLTAGAHRVRFAPICELDGVTVLPISYTPGGDRTVDVMLRVRTAADPLPLAFPGGLEESIAVRAWVLALVGFAELTCVEAVVSDGDVRASRSTQAGAARPVPSERNQRTRRTSVEPPDALAPVGRTRTILASYVAGHRRRLQANQRCSEEARAAARMIGLDLPAGFTWVRPHARGLNSDAHLEFVWHLPRQLRESMPT